ncbi:hypothetical protein [Pseudolysinimonas sp.]|uniref:hypothetical protein n=1 Tax=Pseudolysinimonas sp. TaxID=2680009 RepID=UPI003F7DE35B
MTDAARTPGDLPLAWVESPLQLLCAAEFAAAHGLRIRVAFRLSGPQMSATAAELLQRGAPFVRAEPYYGVPWGLLAEHRDWIVGDGFSGQFRSAMSALHPRTVTLVDDGTMSIHLADALAGRVDYARPGQHESVLKTVLGGLARARMRRLARRGRLGMFTAFSDHPSIAGLTELGVQVRTDAFGWVRAHAKPIALPGSRVVLGSAAVVDGALEPEAYLDWLRSVVAHSDDDRPAAYLPHRREADGMLTRVAALPGVEIVRTGLPVELALAGTAEPLEIVSLRSTAALTLRRVLAGSGSRVRIQVAA